MIVNLLIFAGIIGIFIKEFYKEDEEEEKEWNLK